MLASTNVLDFPGALVQPLSPSDLITTVYFVPFARHLSTIPGVLVDQISFGSFRVAWDVSARQLLFIRISAQRMQL